MKKLLLTIALASAALTAAATRADAIRAKFLNPCDSDVLVAVHRGDWRNYTENSLEGVENAVKLGADIVEVDLRRTADGELVLMHDPKVDRTTTGKGKVEDLTLGQIRALRQRNGVMGRTPYRVPTLRELLVAQKGKVLINLDKAFDYFDQVMALLDETGTTSQIIMKGQAPAAEVVKKYGKYLDRVIYMPIVNLDAPGAVDKVRDYLKVLKPAAMEFVFADSCNAVAPEAGRICNGRTRVWYNSLWSSLAGGHDDFASLENPQQGFGYLVDSLNCSIIQTDQPQYLREWLGKRRKSAHKADFKIYPARADINTGMAVVVCPGGGYGKISMYNEGTPVGEFFADNGITAAVVNYTLPEGHRERPFDDVTQAFDYLRTNAQALGINPKKIGIMGSSAGGHLAATVSTDNAADAPNPAFTILLYPVISSRHDLAHKGSFANLLGKDAPRVERAEYSCELRVNAATPPALLILADDDPTVNPLNSIEYYTALKRFGIPASLHIYPRGRHGFGFTDKCPYLESVKALVLDWLENLNNTEQ